MCWGCAECGGMCRLRVCGAQSFPPPPRPRPAQPFHSARQGTAPIVYAPAHAVKESLACERACRGVDGSSHGADLGAMHGPFWGCGLPWS